MQEQNLKQAAAIRDNIIRQQLAEDRQQQRKKPPRELVTYWCPLCQKESCRTDAVEAFCYGCSTAEGLQEVKREPLNHESVVGRMQAAADRAMQALQESYGSELSDAEELQLLKALAAGQELQKKIDALQNLQK